MRLAHCSISGAARLNTNGHLLLTILGISLDELDTWTASMAVYFERDKLKIKIGLAAALRDIKSLLKLPLVRILF